MCSHHKLHTYHFVSAQGYETYLFLASRTQLIFYVRIKLKYKNFTIKVRYLLNFLSLICPIKVLMVGEFQNLRKTDFAKFKKKVALKNANVSVAFSSANNVL